MSSVLPFDIIAQIIDTVGENKDTNFLKELALVSRSFLHMCSKHLFATVELHGGNVHVASPKKGFIKLLKSRPDVVQYIRKLTYEMGSYHGSVSSHIYLNDDHLLSPILPNFLRTISRLNCLTITAVQLLDWNSLESSLKSALLHLMHLPSINHIDLSFIQNFPLSSLIPSVNLHRLDISYLCRYIALQDDGSPEIVVQSEMPKIREFHTSESSLQTSKLLHAKWQDGRPAFNFMDLRRLSTSYRWFQDEQNIRYLLQNAKLLEKLHLSVGRTSRGLVGLHDILSPSARTLKVLVLAVFLYDSVVAELCEELEAMAAHNMPVLEALSFEIRVDDHATKDFIGSRIQEVERVLIKPGWSVLQQVSFKVAFRCCPISKEVSKETIQSPDKYFSKLPAKHESVAFNYSAYGKCLQ